MMKCMFVIMLVIIVFLTGCGASMVDETYQTQERPRSYVDDIYVTVTKVDRSSWYNRTYYYVVNFTVESKEYGVVKSFEVSGSGMCGCPKEWHYREGQAIKARLRSWVIESTGEVVERELVGIY